MHSKKIMLVLGLLLIASMVLAACAPAPAEPETETVVETVVVTEVVEGETVVQVVTPTPEPEAVPDTLVICMGQEPETLYVNGGSMLAQTSILHAVYEGASAAGFDTAGYSYQAVIYEKVPSLADGDAVINEVTVGEGDTVVDAAQSPIVLDAAADPPQQINVVGSDEPVEYTGGEVTMEQMAVTFKLLPDLMWSDGTPLTSADLLFAHDNWGDPDTPVQSRFTYDRTASFEASDDVTVVWSGLPGFKDAEYFINSYLPLPEHVWGQYSAAELVTEVDADPATMLVGYGPYVLVEYTQGDNIRMVKNENYFRADEGLPAFDNLVFRFIGENANAGVAAVLAGECDIIDQTVGLEESSELLLELQATGAINPTFVTGTVYEHVDFGIQHADYDDGSVDAGDRYDFFSDLRVRQGLAHCMDRQAVVDTVFFGQSSTIDVYIPTVHPLYNPDITTYEYDPEQGMALLAEAGWTDTDGDGILDKDGQPLSITYETTTATQRQQATQILADSLTQCGVEAILNYYPASEWFADWPEGKLFGRRFDLGQFAWLTGVAPACDLYTSDGVPGDEGDTFISILDGNEYETGGPGAPNDAGFVNAEFDAACFEAIGSLPGQPEYEAAHKLAQEIFADNLPVFPLYLRIKLAATRPDMCGFFMDPTENSEMFNIEEFAYGPLCD